MPDLDLTPQDEADLFAAEYVIGLLDPAAHAIAVRRCESDPDFARAVEAWEQRLAPLIDEIGPVAVRDAVWSRISARLPVAVGKGTLWNNTAFWRGTTAVAASLAAVLAVMVVLPRSPAPAPGASADLTPVMASTRMLADDGQVVFVVILDEATRRVIVTPIGSDGTPEHSHELWLLPENEAPISLGVMPSDRSASMPAIASLETGSALAISVEPLGGSPTGQPTGPVVAHGELTAL